MGNFIVSYDLNGPAPTHAQMDAHIRAGCLQYGRILETVWYVRANTNADQLFAYLGQILTPNDRLMVVEGGRIVVRNLLIDDKALINAWNGQHAA
jgi:hypothetical protein